MLSCATSEHVFLTLLCFLRDGFLVSHSAFFSLWSFLSSARERSGELHQSLRSNPFQVNALIGGWDEVQGPSLYFCDYLGQFRL